MSLTLGDAFNRRKKLSADLESWTQRLRQSGRQQRSFRTKAIEGQGAYTPEPGSDRSSERHYTIEECRTRLAEILIEDRELAMRISVTNQKAKAQVVDLDGQRIQDFAQRVKQALNEANKTPLVSL